MNGLKMCECGEPTYTDKCELCFIDDAVKLDITRSLPMNARIKELAEQAGTTHKQNLGVYQFYAHELEKFTDLIVLECIKLVGTTDLEDVEGGDYEVLQAVKRHIKNNFGVK